MITMYSIKFSDNQTETDIYDNDYGVKPTDAKNTENQKNLPSL